MILSEVLEYLHDYDQDKIVTVFAGGVEYDILSVTVLDGVVVILADKEKK